ncbi:hypothetical protein C8J57DRAFT_1499843 [Mycena rebaudengoi]|nr:hypothetical protein C8J57DRAFT_1499843 [Mycena rebaudengoi]
MNVEASVLATRYLSAVGVAALLYDHTLTLVEEARLIWLNPRAELGARVGFAVNRYLTEAMALYAAHISLASTVIVALSNLILAMRVYTLWDRRRVIKWTLLATFGTALTLSMIFAILTAIQLQTLVRYQPRLRICMLVAKPWAYPAVLATWVAFDFFMIAMTVYNALEQPRRKQDDVIVTLQHDGAKMFLCLFRKLLSLLPCVHQH